MKLKKLTLTYLFSYLAIGGIGLALFPEMALKLLFSTGDYGDIMPRVVGMFMCTLGFLIFRIVKNEDWKYYSATIYARSGITLFMVWLYIRSADPLFLVLIGIVLLGLIPSIIIYSRNK